MQYFIIMDNIRRENCKAALDKLDLRKPISVEFKQYRKNRSASQNRTMWMWINAIADALAETEGEYIDPDDLHEMLKQRFLGLEEKTVNRSRNGVVLREILVRPKSTQNLNVQAFTDYLRKIEMLAQEMNIKLPYPDDFKYAIGEK